MSMFERAMQKIKRDTEALHAIPDHEYYSKECAVNEDRVFFDHLHDNLPESEKLAEEDRLNFEDLKAKDNELFSFATEYLMDNWDEFKKLVLMGLEEQDETEIGREFLKQVKAALPDYLSMVRK